MKKYGYAPSCEENVLGAVRFQEYERAVNELIGKTVSYQNDGISLWRRCVISNVLMPDNPVTSRFILVTHDGYHHTIMLHTKIWIGKNMYTY